MDDVIDESDRVYAAAAAAAAARERHILTVDSSVQTGTELLHDMINGLRRRQVSTSTNKSELSHCGENNNSRTPSTSSSIPISEQRLSIRNNNIHSRSPSTSSTIPLSEHCLSIRNNHYRNQTKGGGLQYDTVEPRAMRTYSISPLHTDHSPLISHAGGGTLDTYAYDTTSEETLSELAEPMHDLDSLLKDIQPTAGSLNSLLNSSASLDHSNTLTSHAAQSERGPDRTGAQQQQQQLRQHNRSRSASDSSPNILSIKPIKTSAWKHSRDRCRDRPDRDVMHAISDTKRLSLNGSRLREDAAYERVHVSRGHDGASRGMSSYVPSDDDTGRSLATHRQGERYDAVPTTQRDDAARDMSRVSAIPPRVAVPRILVERASRSSSDVSADSGRPSDCAFDSRRPSLRSARAERTSAEISSIEDLSICVSDLSNPDTPVFLPQFDPRQTGSGRDNAQNVTEFREYLRTKGLKLDLNNVQSSEV